MGANLMLFFVRDWSDLKDIPDLDRLTDAPDLAVSIRNLMFVFEDLASVDESSIREIIQRASRRQSSCGSVSASEASTCRSTP